MWKIESGWIDYLDGQLNCVRGLRILSGLAQLYMGPLCPCCPTPLHFRVCISAPWELSLPAALIEQQGQGQSPHSPALSGHGLCQTRPTCSPPSCPSFSKGPGAQDWPQCPPAYPAPAWDGSVCKARLGASLWLPVHGPQGAASPHFSLVKSIFRDQLVSGWEKVILNHQSFTSEKIISATIFQFSPTDSFPISFRYMTHCMLFFSCKLKFCMLLQSCIVFSVNMISVNL